MIHKTELGEIQSYSNGTYAYYVDGKGWRNMPKELAEKIIKNYSIKNN
jgi:hypothetical protein